MPGFDGMIPPEAGGAAMVYCILHAAEWSGDIINDAFEAMDFPYPNPSTLTIPKMKRSVFPYGTNNGLLQYGTGFKKKKR